MKVGEDNMKKVITMLGMMVTGIVGLITGGILVNKRVMEKDKKVAKFSGYYNMLNQWLTLKQEGKSLEDYFIKNDYNTVAIYGMGEMGNRLYEELKDSSVMVKYAVDQNAATAYSRLTVYAPEEKLPEADVIVITATFAFDEISERLSQSVNMPVISLDEVVFEI